jgi:ER lumen protein retaining receptor
MNIFRLVGDASHCVGVLLLLKLLLVDKNAKGLSLRSQELFLVVFLTRYLDLFTTFYSLYNSSLKIFYIAVTCALVYKIQNGVVGYDQARDIFPHIDWLVLPTACVVLLILPLPDTEDGDVEEFLWTFSILLESVAIVPQLVLLQKYRHVPPTLANGIMCIGVYRALYILNWVYRSYAEERYMHHWIAYIGGAVEVLLYADFFYSYSVNKCRLERDSEDAEQITDMAYKPLLQKRVCCCDHVAKEEDEENKDENSESELARSANTPDSVAPPPYIFNLFTCTYIVCFALAFIAQDRRMIPLFEIPLYMFAIMRVLKGVIKFGQKVWQKRILLENTAFAGGGHTVVTRGPPFAKCCEHGRGKT